MVFADGNAGGHRIVQKKTLDEMLSPQNSTVALDLDSRIGLGWMLNPKGTPELKNAGLVASHGGVIGSFRSQLFILPEHKLGVVVLSNSSTAGNDVGYIGTETLALALEAKSGIQQRKPDNDKIQPDKKPLTATEIGEYVGDYTTFIGFAQIRACGNGLCVHAADRTFDLIRGNDGLFRLSYSLLGIFHINLGFLGKAGISRRMIAGRDVLVARMGDQEFLAGQHVEPLANLESWRHYLGDYEITNLETDRKFVNHVKLIEEQGYLFVEIAEADSHSAKARILLKPLSGDEGILLGQLADGGETVRVVQQNGEERVLYSGYQFKKLVK
jgi:hypothetical protein